MKFLATIMPLTFFIKTKFCWCLLDFRKPILLHLFLFIFIVRHLSADPLFDKFTLLSTKDGLSANHLNAVRMDNNGFLWVGGPNGLQVFDGNSFYTIPVGEGPKKIKGKRIYQILQYDSLNLIVATDIGISKINVLNFNIENLSFESPDPFNYKANQIQEITKSNSGMLWVISVAGVHLVTNTFKCQKSWYFSDSTIQKAFNFQSSRLLHFPDGRIWFVASKVNVRDQSNIIYELKPNAQTFEEIHTLDLCDYKGHLSLININDTVGFFIYRNIYNKSTTGVINLKNLEYKLIDQISFNLGNAIPYISNIQNGLIGINPSFGSMYYIYNLINDSWNFEPIPKNVYIKNIIRYKDLYFGATTDGLLCTGSMIQLFSMEKCVGQELSDAVLVREVEKIDSHYYITSGFNGIIKRNLQDNSCTTIISDLIQKSNQSCKQLIKIDSNRWLINGNKFNFIYHPLDNQISNFLGHQVKQLEDTALTSIFKDSYNNVWFGFYFINRLMVWNTSNNETKWYNLDSINKAIKFLNFSQIIEDQSGNIWFGSSLGPGLLKWIRSKDSFQIYFPSESQHLHFNPTISCFAKDVYGYIWFGTSGHGLYRFHPDCMYFERFLCKDGLKDYANGIVVDCMGKIWIATSVGLVRMDPDNGQEYYFYASHGLPLDDISSIGLIQGESCLIYLSTHKGLFYLDPSQMVIPKANKQFIIRSLKINNNEYLYDNSKPVDLNYDENNIEIQFAHSNLLDGYLNEYYYNFRDIQNTWIPIGHQPMLRLNGMNHGTYHMVIKVCQNGGACFEQELLTFNIQIPFWKNPLTYFIILLIFGLLMFFLLRYRYRFRIASLERIRDHELLRNKIAQDIHDEVGASLTKISLSAQLTARLPQLSANDVKYRLTKLGEDAMKASAQLREIVFSINPEFDRFEELQAYLKEQANLFWDDHSISVHYFFPKNGPNNNVSPDVKRQIILIFREIQTNIAKYAKASQIKISFYESEHDFFILEVEDNGIGFDINSIPTYSHGLSGMKRRAESIGAVVEIQSDLGKGSKIYLKGKTQVNLK